MKFDVNKQPKEIDKESVIDNLAGREDSSFKKYKDFFVGRQHIGYFLKYEIITSLLGALPGGAGILFRKWAYPSLLKKTGSGILWGKNVILRHPGMIKIGDNVGIDDGCMLDAKGAGKEGIEIGDDVLIARNTVIQGKTSWVTIGNRCVIGNNCTLTSAGGISIGNFVGIAGHCYIGGARYWYDDRDIPILDQGAYSRGPVVIGDDVWLGAGAIVTDGVRIGRGCVISAGAAVMEDLPEYSVLLPQQKYMKLPRG